MSEVTARLAVDALSAGLASACISPVIFMIDKSIMEATSGKAESILHSLRASSRMLVKTPTTFLTSVPFLLLYSVYFATYTTANAFDTLTSFARPSMAEGSNWGAQSTGFGKFLTTTAVNLSACVYKDMRYAKLYGTGQPRRMPTSTLLMFAARDSLTVSASFNIPALLAPTLGLNAAQLVTPCAMQLISTPMHLLGLDIYNRPGQPAGSRASVVASGYFRSTVARIGRILPAFGVGGVLNRTLREDGMQFVHGILRHGVDQRIDGGRLMR